MKFLNRPMLAAGIAGAVGLAGIALAAPAGAAVSTARGTVASQRVLAELGQVQNLLPAGTQTPAAAAVNASEAPASAAHATIALKDAGGATSQVKAGVSVTPDALPNTDGAVIKGANETSNVFVLRNASAATDVKFEVNDFGGKLVADPLGGVLLVDASGTANGRINAPWAYDAKGRSLPTTFTVDGTTITQHVDTRGAAFPVVADPHYTWGWITGTVYFNKSETGHMAANAGFVAGIFAFAPAPFNLIGVLVAGNISRVAWNASSDGKCVKVKSEVPVFPAAEYSGGYCS